MPLTPSVASVAKDKDDNEMIPGAVHRSPGIYLSAEENPGDRLIKAVRAVIASIGVPNLQIRLVGSHNTSGMEKGRNKERTGISRKKSLTI